MKESTVWAIVAGVAGTIAVTLIIVFNVYEAKIEIAAINKGLCQVTVPGANNIVWSSCPK